MECVLTALSSQNHFRFFACLALGPGLIFLSGSEKRRIISLFVRSASFLQNANINKVSKKSIKLSIGSKILDSFHLKKPGEFKASGIKPRKFGHLRNGGRLCSFFMLLFWSCSTLNSTVSHFHSLRCNCLNVSLSLSIYAFNAFSVEK